MSGRAWGDEGGSVSAGVTGVGGGLRRLQQHDQIRVLKYFLWLLCGERTSGKSKRESRETCEDLFRKQTR